MKIFTGPIVLLVCSLGLAVGAVRAWAISGDPSSACSTSFWVSYDPVTHLCGYHCPGWCPPGADNPICEALEQTAGSATSASCGCHTTTAPGGNNYWYGFYNGNDPKSDCEGEFIRIDYPGGGGTMQMLCTKINCPLTCREGVYNIEGETRYRCNCTN